MDGLWSSQGSSETLNQAELVRHRILTFNTDPTGVQNGRDQSGFGSVNPAAIAAPQGGPHFIMSPRAPEDSKSYGFEWCLLTLGFVDFVASATAPNSKAGPFDVTIWELIGNTMVAGGVTIPMWASFATRFGVFVNELFHTFDVDATALRFQITNVVPFQAGPPQSGGSIMVAFAEL